MNGSGSWISLLTEGSARKALVNATGEAVGAYPTGQAAPAFGCIVSEYTLDRRGIKTGPRNACLPGFLARDGCQTREKRQPRSPRL